MNKIVQVSLLSLALAAIVGQSALASEGHDGGHAGMNMSGSSNAGMEMGAQSKMFLEKRDINGYTVSFHVMEAVEGMQSDGSHNLMFKVENQASPIEDIKINSKVVFPDGSEQSKAPMKMGEWFSAGYDLGAKGEHQLMVLFKTSDGKKHFGGVKYIK